MMHHQYVSLMAMFITCVDRMFCGVGAPFCGLCRGEWHHEKKYLDPAII